jgi:hypothetical protein
MIENGRDAVAEHFDRVRLTADRFLKKLCSVGLCLFTTWSDRDECLSRGHTTL